jgi:hypothetical protein
MMQFLQCSMLRRPENAESCENLAVFNDGTTAPDVLHYFCVVHGAEYCSKYCINFGIVLSAEWMTFASMRAWKTNRDDRLGA